CCSTSCIGYYRCNRKGIGCLTNDNILVKGTSVTISDCNMIGTCSKCCNIFCGGSKSTRSCPGKCQCSCSTCCIECDRPCCCSTSCIGHCRCNRKGISCLTNDDILVKGTSVTISDCNMIGTCSKCCNIFCGGSKSTRSCPGKCQCSCSTCCI